MDRPELENVLENLRRNEELSRKFFEIEVSILSILNFEDLFERLLSEIKEKFGVPYVWLSMIEKSEISDLLQTMESSKALRNRLNVIDRDTFLELIGHQTSPRLVNDNLEPYYRLLPQGQMYFMRSLAIAPLTFGGEIIGSLNQADLSRLRYRPGMDTRFLRQLAVKVSISLSNVSAHERVQWLAVRDPLTGLLNRRVMETVLGREFKRAVRYKTPLSLAFIDLDDFKVVNDKYGHDRGDAQLRYVASQLKGMTRETDIVARYAGDEFVIILPGTTPREAQRLLERLQLYFLNNPLDQDGLAIPVSISYGLAAATDAGVTDAASLLSRADQMLCNVKRWKAKEGTTRV